MSSPRFLTPERSMVTAGPPSREAPPPPAPLATDIRRESVAALTYRPDLMSYQENFTGAMTNSPALRGMNGYSKVLLPEVPALSVFWVALISYMSKSGGNCTLGASSRVTFPLPETVTSSDAASWVLSESLLRDAEMLYEPTPPVNEAGAPEGSGETLTVTGAVFTVRFAWV